VQINKAVNHQSVVSIRKARAENSEKKGSTTTLNNEYIITINIPEENNFQPSTSKHSLERIHSPDNRIQDRTNDDDNQLNPRKNAICGIAGQNCAEAITVEHDVDHLFANPIDMHISNRNEQTAPNLQEVVSKPSDKSTNKAVCVQSLSIACPAINKSSNNMDDDDISRLIAVPNSQSESPFISRLPSQTESETHNGSGQTHCWTCGTKMFSKNEKVSTDLYAW